MNRETCKAIYAATSILWILCGCVFIYYRFFHYRDWSIAWALLLPLGIVFGYASKWARSKSRDLPRNPVG